MTKDEAQRRRWTFYEAVSLVLRAFKVLLGNGSLLVPIGSVGKRTGPRANFLSCSLWGVEKIRPSAKGSKGGGIRTGRAFLPDRNSLIEETRFAANHDASEIPVKALFWAAHKAPYGASAPVSLVQRQHACGM
jgi:hypothetical protein